MQVDYEDLWHFCDVPVCPDPVYKLSTFAGSWDTARFHSWLKQIKGEVIFTPNYVHAYTVYIAPHAGRSEDYNKSEKTRVYSSDQFTALLEKASEG